MSSSYHLPTSTPAPGTAKPWEPFTQPRFCAVCGKATTNRCSKCATTQHDIFFCSPEHQQLVNSRTATKTGLADRLSTQVWPTHRRLCGGDLVEAIRGPWLSKREADEASTHFNYEDPSWSGDRESIARWLQQMSRRRVTPEILRDWTEGQRHPKDLPLAQDVLGVVRENEFDRNTFGTNLDNAYLDCDAFTVVHYIRSTVSPAVPSPELWHEGWLHRLAILVALIQRYKAGDPAAPLSICRDSYQQMERFLLTAKPMTNMPYAPDILLSRLHRVVDPSTMRLTRITVEEIHEWGMDDFIRMRPHLDLVKMAAASKANK